MAATTHQGNTHGILAIFDYLDELCHAIERIKDRRDFHNHEILSPTSYHEIEHACGYSPSPVRWFTLCGALSGTVTGFALALLCDWDWPVIVGGKLPGIYSIPAYVVLGFEFTILFGAIATVLGVLVMCRIPNPKINVVEPRTTDDKFAIFVPGATLDGEQAKMLRDCGATNIKNTEW